MTRFVHRLTLAFYVIIVIFAVVALTYIGYRYYRLPIEERFFSPQYQQLKPSGFIGHGLGVVGSIIMLFGLFSYMARKRLKIFSRIGVLKYWLEFHIFTCTLGPVLILFHTSFKFGGIISVGFWSMAIVWISGFIGRFIYLQIPHTIEGRELSLREVQELKENIDSELLIKYNINISDFETKELSRKISRKEYKIIRSLLRTEKRISNRIKRLDRMKRLFNYWHFAHLPFALIMLIILVVHVGVAFAFGYKWIF
jgi:hypothetical protein